MSRPLVTVLLPVRDAGATLAECLDSIRGQTLWDFELLAVDDGSTDAGPALLRAAAAEDPRVRVVQSDRRGLVACLNEGLRQARAPLVARMDADDRMARRRLEVQVEHLRRHPALDVLGCQVRPFPEARVTAGMREYLRWQNACVDADRMAADIYRESPLTHPSVMLRREVVLASGGYREGPFPEDYELWLRLVHGGRRLAKVPEVLLHWRLSGGSHSRTAATCSREAFDRLRAGYLARDPRLHGNRPLVFWGAGRRTRGRATLLQSHGFTPAAWIDIDPRKVGNVLDGVPVHPPEWLAARAPRPFVLVYVASHGAPDRIGARLTGMGYGRGRDFLVVG